MGNKYTSEAREDRRSVPRSETVFFKIMLALNVLGWSSLVVVLVVALVQIMMKILSTALILSMFGKIIKLALVSIIKSVNLSV